MARQTREMWRNVIGQFERSGKAQEQFAAEREIRADDAAADPALAGVVYRRLK